MREKMFGQSARRRGRLLTIRNIRRGQRLHGKYLRALAM